MSSVSASQPSVGPLEGCWFADKIARVTGRHLHQIWFRNLHSARPTLNIHLQRRSTTPSIYPQRCERALTIPGSVVLLAVISPWFLIAVAVVLVLYVHCAGYYRASSREFKRIDSILRSSLYSHFSESLSGISTIRAYGEGDRFCAENVKRMDVENRGEYWPGTWE